MLRDNNYVHALNTTKSSINRTTDCLISWKQELAACSVISGLIDYVRLANGTVYLR